MTTPVVALTDLSSWQRDLIAAAESAQASAYVPYTGHAVGAAVLAGGRIHAAPNVEIVTLQQSVHAERNAVNVAVAAGERRITAVALYGPYSGIPCAECRQVIWEFAGADGSVPIIGLTTEGELSVVAIGDLYPMPYGPETKGINPLEH